MILLFNFFKVEIRRNWFGVGGFFLVMGIKSWDWDVGGDIYVNDVVCILIFS